MGEQSLRRTVYVACVLRRIVTVMILPKIPKGTLINVIGRSASSWLRWRSMDIPIGDYLGHCYSRDRQEIEGLST
jgi:hypothetical protein